MCVCGGGGGRNKKNIISRLQEHMCKTPVKFQKHLLKAVGGVVLTRYLLL